MAAGQDCLGGQQVGGRGAQIGHQFRQRFELGQKALPGPLSYYFRGIVAEILELAGRGVGL